VTRHSIIALREEARRLAQAVAECACDQTLTLSERIPLVRQMTLDLDDVRQALLALGGPEALKTVF
jgi:hypothetical protein